MVETMEEVPAKGEWKMSPFFSAWDSFFKEIVVDSPTDGQRS
jgi:hypothetical protein